ncbi:MAG: hypothetical protein ABH804_03195 [archaeon]
METFLDTCIIINNFDEKSSFNEISKKFIFGNQNIILCFYQKQKEIPYLIWRLKLTSKIIKTKALFSSKETPEIKMLTKEDKMKVRKILANYELGLINIKDIFDLQEQTYLLERKLNNFIKTKIKRFVTPLDKINPSLVNSLFELNKNKADSKIIASGIEEYKKNNLILITTDKRDWKREYLEKACKMNSYPRIPEVKFLQDE